MLACMDARLSVDGILGLEDAGAHVIRKTGGVVSDDAIRSLLISLATARDPEAIVLIRHSDCDMLTFGDDEVKAAVGAETGLAPLFALEVFADLGRDVRRSVARIRRTRWCRTTTPSAASSVRLPWAPCGR
jgi:carbonic anhydrase